MFIRAYLRASTDDQDASRARGSLQAFADEKGAVVACWYAENASGAKLARPELMRLLSDARAGDVLLVESIDRLTRLPGAEWQQLKTAIDSKGVRIVALDLPTSYQGMTPSKGDEFTDRMLGAINGLMVELAAAIAAKDYTQRRERQAQGIATLKAKGGYTGRAPDLKLHRSIMDRLSAGMGVRETARLCNCSTTTVMRVRDLEAAQ